MAETVKSVDPIPPKPRNTSSCQYSCENATRNMDSATIRTPVMYAGVSPKRLVRRPENGANSSRVRPKAETTAETAVADALKDWAYCGSTGAMMPKPIAMMKAAAMRTLISRGMGTLPARGARETREVRGVRRDRGDRELGMPAMAPSSHQCCDRLDAWIRSS